jgi:Ca2+-binding RTX toxin-like protein
VRLRVFGRVMVVAMLAALLPLAPAGAVMEDVELFGDFPAFDGTTLAMCDAGAVYLYVRGTGGWEMQDVINKPGLCAGNYPDSVEGAPPLAVLGDTLLVGAFTERQRRGAAYVYRRTGTDWSLEATLLAPEEYAGRYQSFGFAVALWGDWAAVATPGDEQGGDHAGAVYLFSRGDSGWVLRQTILGVVWDQLGYSGTGPSVLFADGYLYVTSVSHSGTVGDVAVPGSGIVYIHQLQGTTWVPAGSLDSGAPVQGERFGGSIAVAGDRMAISSICQGDCVWRRVYTYKRIGGEWVRQQTLTDPLPAVPGYDFNFGTGLGLTGTTLAVSRIDGVALYRLKQGRWRLWSWLETGGPLALVGTTLVTRHAYDITPGCEGRRATIVGTPGDDIIVGTEGDDVIDGLAGNDTISGLGGNDVLCGDLGDDRLDGGPGDDVLVGGLGADTADYSAAPAGVVVDLDAHQATGGAGNDVLLGVERVTGSAYDDHLSSLDQVAGNLLAAGGGNDTLEGDTGDELFGEAGDDLFIGHLRRATCDGGPGFDTIDYSAEAQVVVDLPAGRAHKAFPASDWDAVVGIEAALGTPGDDTLLGDAGANLLFGGAGDDTVQGGGGDDTLDGGPGLDTVSYAGAPRRVVVDLGAGTASGEGNDTLAGFENAIGSRFGDEITGDGGSNNLRGGPGRDTLFGLEGNDVLLGEGGNDTLWGGGGNDELSGGTGSDYLVGGVGDDRYMSGVASFENASGPIEADLAIGTARGEGRDRLIRVTGLVGGPFADRLVGAEGDDLLMGLGGDDELLGAGGDDLLLGGPGNDHLDGGPGWDAVSYEFAASAVVVDLAGTATGEGADTLAGVEDAVGGPYADTLRGTAGSNYLFGLAGNDRLYGLDGDDYLNGGPGTDSLDGGPGTDYCIAGESHAACEFYEAVAGAVSDVASRLARALGGRHRLPVRSAAIREEGE